MACSFARSNYIDFRLHIMLVGKRPLCTALSEAMQEMSQNFSLNLEIHFALNLSTLVKENVDASFDFIVIVHDIRERMEEFTLDFFQKHFQQVDKHYRSAQRVAISLPVESKTADSFVKYQNIITRASSFSIPVIRGDLKSPDAAEDMAERLLELIASNTGAYTGYAAPISIFN